MTSWFLLLFIPFIFTIHAEDRAVCHESDDYLIVEGSTSDVGTHFVVKYKSKNKKSLVCENVINPDDFEIPNERAEYFLGLQGDLLILDSGTGPYPRGLIIWNLKKRKKVYTGTYSEDIKIKPEYMEFWLETGSADDKNCPQAKKWKAKGLGAAIETLVRLEYITLKLSKRSKTRCSPRQ